MGGLGLDLQGFYKGHVYDGFTRVLKHKASMESLLGLSGVQKGFLSCILAFVQIL